MRYLHNKEYSHLVREAYWGKIVAIRKWLPHYNYILYLDADLLIANLSLSLEVDRAYGLFCCLAMQGRPLSRK